MICFIANSENVSADRPKSYEAFIKANHLTAKYFYEFLDWLLLGIFKSSNLIVLLFRDNKCVIISGITASLALITFRKELKEMASGTRGQWKKTCDSFISWLEKIYKAFKPGCLVLILLLIYLLLTLMSDVPKLPLAKNSKRFYFKKLCSKLFSTKFRQTHCNN
jgi:hypothetical protein